jgi:hypothetical protein
MTSEDSLTEIEAVVAESNYITEDFESLKTDLEKDAKSSPEVAETKETEEATKEHSEKPKRPGRLERENIKQAQRIAELEARFEQSIESQPDKSEKPDVNAPPEMSQYADAVEYFEALQNWKIERAFKKINTEAEDTRLYQDFHQRQQVVINENPEYSDTIQDMYEDGLVTNRMIDYIRKESPLGEKVALHLTKYPKDAEIISQLSGNDFVRAMYDVERFVSKDKEEVAVVRNTKAPQPITPVKTNATSSKDPGDEDYDESRVKRIARRKALGLPY